VAQNLAAFASLAAEDDAFLGELAAAALVRLQQAYGLDAVGLGALAGPVRRRVWVRWFEGQGISPDLGMIERAEAALAAGGEATLQGGLRLDARGGWVRVGRPRQESASPALEVSAVALALGESRRWGDYLVGLSAERPSAARWASAIPGAALPLQLRGRSPGDRLPVRGHHRRLQDLLVDAKIPREQRSGLPVVCDSRGSPLWIPGVPALCRHDAKATDVWLWAQRIAEASDEADPGL
jgi:tRNA(Ile)-lysidine synthase